MKPTKEIDLSPFNGIIGQSLAVRQFQQGVRAQVNGGNSLSCLTLAPAGGGKTHLCNAFGRALEINCGVAFHATTPTLFRRLGTEWDTVRELIALGDYCLFIDECHELFESGATVQQKNLRSFLMRALDGNFSGGSIQFGEDVVNFSRKNCGVVMATNFPHKLPEAMRTRATKIELELYSEAQLATIAAKMLENKGIRANEDSLKIMARCGRGTARIMEKMAEKLETNLIAEGGKSTANKADIFQALIDCQYYPRGFSQAEIEMLAFIAPSPRRLNQIETVCAKLGKGVKASIAYALVTGFVYQTTGGFHLSDKGRRYFDDCAKAGFPVPELND